MAAESPVASRRIILWQQNSPDCARSALGESGGLRIAPNSGKLCKLGASADHERGKPPTPQNEKTPTKQAVLWGFGERRGRGSNPQPLDRQSTELELQTDSGQQVTSTPTDGCTTGCTRIEVGTHETVETLAERLRLVLDAEGLDRLVRLLCST